jgi:AcrR family transcriptional regulator
MAQPSNRDQLIKGAIQCLKTKGYASTTARDITAASDANLASIGYHFGSKEALLNEALIQILDQRNRRVGKLALVSENDSPLRYLTAMFNAATGVFKAPRPLLVAFVEAIAQAERSDELREQMAGHYRDGRSGIAEALKANLGGRDPEVMASLLLALFDGLLLQRLLDDSTTPTGEQLLAALVDLAGPASRRMADKEDPGGSLSRSAEATRRPKTATRRRSPPVPTTKRETSR